ncbi:MAG TPA: hypothetical protein VHI13_06660 [Candidatus Kapabacteria bacterium]|nr:hypothetical protein [Candidatus Kapabacteria bacterium]
MRTNRRTASVQTLCLVPLMLAACAVPLAAQSSGGSTYSIFNIGDLQTGTTASAAGRAGVETAVPSNTIINSLNPAGWQDLHVVTLQAGMNFEQYRVSDGNTSIYQNNSKLQNFAACFPWSESLGGTVAFAVHPYSTVTYRTMVQAPVNTGDSNTTMESTYGGHGGISEALVGSSIRPFPWLALGATADLYFGSITSTTNVSFSDPNLNTANYQTTQRYVGFGGRFGVQAKPFEELRLGAVYETGGRLNRQSVVSTTVQDNGNQFYDTLSSTEQDVNLPARITFGAALVTGRFLLSSDVSMQSWNRTEFPNARNTARYAVGVDRLASTSLNASGFDRWAFRMGAYYDQTYYRPGTADGIDQMGVTLGLRCPLSTMSATNNSNTAMDVALEFGQRGKTVGGLTKETYGKLSLQLSVSELWFVRSRR